MTETLTPVLTLIAAISAAHHTAQRLVEARLPKGLGAAQFAVLERLIRLGEGQTPRSIAAAFGWPKTSMSHTLAVLESRGLVRLEPNPRDGRSKCLWLTPKGRTMAMTGVTAVEQDMARIAGLAPLAAVEALARDLASLAERLEDQRRFPEAA
ncbi:MarR family winged helix-turn-helix transcriptional regulator [Fuscovulum ytuae]|jgi:DNA-binding MarR family transcriptional regulator|uniref:MarR family transcriptional regulator n=1 Tax=Fuscovulum ytuae TaxID=3042299 RepID=A0ABY8QD23_9RHOB|nr:MarR family transcriptional regulator [Fuscovulum sp. YMD61]WGV17946.1 MarR family transcriptional regulator [Fuscovulum sp. YMD61]